MIGLEVTTIRPSLRLSGIGKAALWVPTQRINYVPQPPVPAYGYDMTVWQMANYSQSTSGLATRGYQLQPRSMLWFGGWNIERMCQSYQFNPACDRPQQLDWRPETLVSQIMGMLTLNVSGLRLYNFFGNMPGVYTAGLGWQNNNPAYNAMNPFVSPKQWAAMAHTNLLIKLRDDTELQPPANKPYYGPMFLTDAHTSAAYGNELKIVCASEMPYGQFRVNLPAISGGSMIRYDLTAYSLRVSTMSGNPSTDTEEFCPTPGKVTTFVALPPVPAVNPIDQITAFGPPTTLPFGASKIS